MGRPRHSRIGLLAVAPEGTRLLMSQNVGKGHTEHGIIRHELTATRFPP
jgi:hypothetical protein